MAVVVTYCRRSPHDRYFFDDPLHILGGVIEAPTFNLRNPLMVAKHIRSAILSKSLLLPSKRMARQNQSVRSSKDCFPSSFAVTCWMKRITSEKRRPARHPWVCCSVRSRIPW